MHSYSVAGGTARAVAVPWRAYWQLCKPKVVLLVTFTAMVYLAGAIALGIGFLRSALAVVSH